MPHYSAHKVCQKNYEKIQTRYKINKNKIFRAKTQNLNLEAPSNNVKMQPDKILFKQN